MSLKSGLFNAIENDGEYDREYGSEFFSRLISAIFRNFIAPGTFKVTASGGLNLSVAAGEGFLNGVFFYDDSASTLTCTSATGTRHDLVVARINSEERNVSINVKANATTTDSNELAIADVTVTGSSITAVENRKYTHFLRNIPAITFGADEPADAEEGDIHLRIADS